ncbi:polyadenylate-binding protein-interacting protein 2B-like [Acanthaster planci]|uniref:Polyadenylate-binding protein-interacting protein 2B-like n=1 Tax=Acanthaster planci TaxID=133434 RepID=A0A8B8A3K2_ACAPL|nr:polyadenylate-binding protein-interacting protein 2B-like [Acanthaster planci]
MEKTSSGSGDGGAESDPTKTQKDSITMTTSSEQDNPFEEYMWMGDPQEEDAVNLQVMEQILEEEFIESCFEDMLEEEALGLFSPPDEQGDGDDVIPSLHSLSLDSGAVSDLEGVDGGTGDPEDEWRGGAEGSPPSGFGGQSSDGESENSDSDSLGDTPQR